MGHLENIHSTNMNLRYLQKPSIHCAQFGTRIGFLKNTRECELNIEVDPVINSVNADLINYSRSD